MLPIEFSKIFLGDSDAQTSWGLFLWIEGSTKFTKNFIDEFLEHRRGN